MHFAKSRRFFSLRYSFNYASFSIPHPDKVSYGGDDSSICHPGLLGVFDGVSKWSLKGITSKKFSDSLATNVKRVFITQADMLMKNPKRLLGDAANQTVAKGSATACICFLDLTEPLLHFVNLGDSKAILLRERHGSTKKSSEMQLELIFETHQQFHEDSNIPYQIGYYSRDNYFDSDYTGVTVEEGDLIVLATDGLWDNVPVSQAVNILAPLVSGRSPKVITLARVLSESAADVAKSTRVFESLGKVVDVTVVVGRVEKNI